MTAVKFGGGSLNVRIGAGAKECPPADPVTIQDQEGGIVTTVQPGGIYPVIVFRGMIDTGGPYTSPYILADPL